MCKRCSGDPHASGDRSSMLRMAFDMCGLWR